MQQSLWRQRNEGPKALDLLQRITTNDAEWHNIVLQNGLAKVANQYVKKGDKLYIEGKLRTRSYDDAQGVKRYITEIVATDMEMLTPKTTGAGTQAPQTAPPAPAPEPSDDLPF